MRPLLLLLKTQLMLGSQLRIDVSWRRLAGGEAAPRAIDA